MLPVIQIGRLALNGPATALLLGAWLALWLSEREAKRLNLSGDALSGAALAALIAGVIVARLAYAARAPGAYLADPLALIMPNLSAFDPGPGLIGGVAIGLLDLRRRHLPLWRSLDALAPGVAVLAAAHALSQLAGGDGFGAPAHLPWSIYLWEEWRHPTQIYALLGALASLGLSYTLRNNPLGDGTRMALALAILAGTRLFIEAFRGDSLIITGGFRAAQLVSIALLGVCLWMIPRLQRAK